jgi:hypothetical protein
MSEAILLESVPQYPDFNKNGIVRTAIKLGLQINDFVTYFYLLRLISIYKIYSLGIINYI